MENNLLFKTIIIGDGNCGKTCILKRFVHDVFDSTRVETLGLDFYFKEMKINGQAVKLQIWDTAGQEYFQSIIRSYWAKSHAIIIVFDLTCEESFERVNYWLNETKVALPHWSELKIVIVGNKSDLTKQRCIDYETAKQFADDHDLPYYETSAKTGKNINEMFQDIGEACVEKIYPYTLPAKSFRIQESQLNTGWFEYCKSFCNIL